MIMGLHLASVQFIIMAGVIIHVDVIAVVAADAASMFAIVVIVTFYDL